MVVVPADIPVTIPEMLPMVATVVMLLVHVPPLVASVKAAVDPTQVVSIPVIPEGSGLMVTVIVV